MENLAHSHPVDARAADDQARYRPRLHFAPQRNWMNDPNGLVYFAGEYHLFYQYNPYGDQWGHMSWGHAVSQDLVTWEELAVAIPEQAGEMIFSGSIIVDWDNVSGLGVGGEPPLLAYYTGFDAVADIQRQCLAYSHDRGRTFSFYAGNPVIDLGMAHFRDPKVFWHAPSSAWVMVVALSREHKVQFYRSTNLLDWSLTGSFGPAGATSGQWECPDLMLVPLQNDPLQTRWVLKVDVDAAFVGGGSGAQYFVGKFDGFSFIVDRDSADGDTVDFGPDFYAAISWGELPSEQPGPLWIGWMSNHQTGRFYPTQPWRGAQSLPRTLFVFEEAGRWKLGQRPVASAAKLFEAPQRGVVGDLTVASGPTKGSFHASVSLTVTEGASETMVLVAGDEVLLSIRYEREPGLIFNRNDHGDIPEGSLTFETVTAYPTEGRIAIELFFDSCLVDIFVDGGKRVYSCCVFPEAPAFARVALEQ
ncbi:glycoside hydrolase family 32 protein [Sphingomonas glacialis]|nr:glycoside hydrolase family 32 protein [Sphingomonas glacialis]